MRSGSTYFPSVSARSLWEYGNVLTLVCEVFETVSAYGTVGLSLGIPTVRVPSLFLPLRIHGSTLVGKLFFLWGPLHWFEGLALCRYD